MKNKLIKSISILIIGLAFTACDGNNTQAVTEDKNIENVATNDATDEQKEELVDNEDTSDEKDLAKSEDNEDNKETKTETIDVSKKSDEEEKEHYKEDGRYFASLIASKKGEMDDMIGPTAYEIKFDEDYLVVSGSINYLKEAEDYENSEDIENKEDHRFVVNDDTVFQAVGGTADPEIFDRESFIEWYQGVKDSGLALIIILEDGIAKTVSISS